MRGIGYKIFKTKNNKKAIEMKNKNKITKKNINSNKKRHN